RIQNNRVGVGRCPRRVGIGVLFGRRPREIAKQLSPGQLRIVAVEELQYWLRRNGCRYRHRQIPELSWGFGPVARWQIPGLTVPVTGREFYNNKIPTR